VIGAGKDHVCAVNRDRKVECWQDTGYVGGNQKNQTTVPSIFAEPDPTSQNQIALSS